MSLFLWGCEKPTDDITFYPQFVEKLLVDGAVQVTDDNLAEKQSLVEMAGLLTQLNPEELEKILTQPFFLLEGGNKLAVITLTEERFSYKVYVIPIV